MDAETITRIEGKLDEIRAILLEFVTWKSEVEQALEQAKSSGMFGMLSKMMGGGR